MISPKQELKEGSERNPSRQAEYFLEVNDFAVSGSARHDGRQGKVREAEPQNSFS